MRKLLGILLTLAMLAGMFTVAMAEGAPVLVGKISNADWIDGTNYLQVQGSNGYGIMKMDGTMLTGTLYGRSFTYDGNVIVAAQLGGDEINAWGAFRMDGSTVVPFQYGDVEVLSEEWAVAYVLTQATADQYDYSSWTDSSLYLLIDHVDVYNLVSGACVATLTRAQFADAQAVGHSINIEDRSTGVVTTYDANFNALGTCDYISDTDYAQVDIVTFRENGQYGLKDSQGNVIMQPSFYSIYDFDHGYAEVSTGEVNGLIDASGNVVIAPAYDRIVRNYYMPMPTDGDNSGYEANGYFCVELDGKLGYVDASGNVTCEPTYSKDILENNGASALYTDMEGKKHILAADGADTTVEGYENLRAADFASGMFYYVTDADYNYGLIDWHGNVVFPCQYSGITISGDGRYALVDVDYENSEIYELSYPVAGTAAAVEGDAAGDETPAAEEDAVMAEEPVAEAVPDAEELPTTEAPAMDPAPETTVEAEASADTPAAETDYSAVVALLDSAKLLLNSDAATNRDAVINLLNSAVQSLGDANLSATTLIDSAISLLEQDAAANAASVIALLDSVAALF